MYNWQDYVNNIIPQKIQELLLSGNEENFKLAVELSDHPQFIAVWFHWFSTLKFELGLIDIYTPNQTIYPSITRDIWWENFAGMARETSDRLIWAKKYLLEYSTLNIEKPLQAIDNEKINRS